MEHTRFVGLDIHKKRILIPVAESGHSRWYSKFLALEPRLQILRRHRRPLLLRLEQAYRYALENHLHRNKKVGLSVVISGTWYKTERRLLLQVAISAAKPPFDSIRDLIASMPEASDLSRQAVRTRQAELPKPLGSLGRLEEIAGFLAAWQAKPTPSIDRPLVAVFAGNHGVVETGLLLRRTPNAT